MIILKGGKIGIRWVTLTQHWRHKQGKQLPVVKIELRDTSAKGKVK